MSEEAARDRLVSPNLGGLVWLSILWGVGAALSLAPLVDCWAILIAPIFASAATTGSAVLMATDRRDTTGRARSRAADAV